MKTGKLEVGGKGAKGGSRQEEGPCANAKEGGQNASDDVSWDYDFYRFSSRLDLDMPPRRVCMCVRVGWVCGLWQDGHATACCLNVCRVQRAKLPLVLSLVFVRVRHCIAASSCPATFFFHVWKCA